MKQEGIAGRIVGYAVGIVSVGWIAILVAYLFGFRSGFASFDKILDLSPDNFGDFLSGAFAPLAFILLAYSVWIQQQELRLTRDVMKDQEAALKSSSHSNLQLAEETRKQNEIEIASNKIQYFSMLTNEFYNICKTQKQIFIYKSQNGYASFQLASPSNNNNDIMPNSAFHIVRNINSAIEFIKNKKDIFASDLESEGFIGFCRIVFELEGLSRSSDLSLALHKAHGFDQLYNSLVELKMVVET
ncbi:MAG: hypothetical protein IOC54_14440 [Methylobacterium sp.]|nr:hypothetical protein [Methylobacterium sp.]MCA3653019.1 hypothetical protein [Methylobacterium sp.]MCA4921984.1 hypothetical protein [Methylobacterium sp.]